MVQLVELLRRHSQPRLLHADLAQSTRLQLFLRVEQAAVDGCLLPIKRSVDRSWIEEAVMLLPLLLACPRTLLAGSCGEVEIALGVMGSQQRIVRVESP